MVLDGQDEIGNRIISSDAGRVFATGIAGVGLTLAFTATLGGLPVSLILLVLLMRAIGTAFHTPTLQAITPQLVPKEELTKCAGYTQSLQSVSQILSPALAAVLYSAWDLSAIIFLDVIGALIAVSFLMVCKIPKHEGVSGPFYWGIYTPLLQEKFEEKYMGRVLSITSSIRLLTGPFALIVSGVFADYFGEENWFLVAGVIVAVAALICLINPSIHNCDK